MDFMTKYWTSFQGIGPAWMRCRKAMTSNVPGLGQGWMGEKKKKKRPGMGGKCMMALIQGGDDDDDESKKKSWQVD